ncbi:MAG: cysteine desulfurase NifS [Clostridia bacterium]|nr:cysteine desulfurase NifS [Clostridia bacterium]
MQKIIYADNAATTSVSKQVLDAMLPFLSEQFGNPSSLYSIGREAKEAVDRARKQVANAIGAKPEEIFFTSCGSESDNWALRGVAHAQAAKGKKHIITTEYEHHAVLETVEALAKDGYDITLVKPDGEGIVSPETVEAAIRPDTALVAVMYANNEIGTINPIADIGAVCKKHGVVFFTDAVQAVGHVEIDVAAQNIDLLSLSGHKIHAPKGIGALYIRKGVRVDKLITGGQQERGRRAGTENVPYIVGLGAAIEAATADIAGHNARVTAMRERLIDGLLAIPDTRLNGSRTKRLCGNANVSFEGIEGESLLLWLDMKGICASTGSACASASLDPSHVLLSIGVPVEIAHGSLRVSLGDDNTDEEVDAIVAAVTETVERLRAMSPIYNK